MAFSDKILLNKVDLVTPDELVAIRKDIRKINHFAEVIECERSKVDLKKIIGINSFDIEKCIDLDPVLFKKTEGEEPTSGKVHDLSMVSSCGISVEGSWTCPSSTYSWRNCCRRGPPISTGAKGVELCRPRRSKVRFSGSPRTN